MSGIRERLKILRERRGLSEHEAAAAIGINSPSYFDLEQHESEFFMCISLRGLKKLFIVLDTRLSDVVGVSSTSGIAGGFADLAAAINERIGRGEFTIEQFEERAGWEIADFLKNPECAWNWNVDGLRDVCGAAGFDWVAVLSMEAQSDQPSFRDQS